VAEHILLRHRDIAGLDDLDVYLKNGGFDGLRKAVTTLTPQQVIDEVKTSGLRGRGGAGFPAGVKWSFLTPGVFPRYVVANADESEPGTFKDREILERNPYQFLEGLAICAYAAQAQTAYVYCRGEFWDVAAELEKRIGLLRARGLLGGRIFGTEFRLDVHVHLGAGAYICGEETALLDSVEGKLGQPRLRPPFPAAEGLYGKPTVINNVETLTNLPPILTHGASWYRSIGTEKSPGPKIFCLSGRVVRPGNYELPLGTTFRELISVHGGGVPNGGKVKAILPAGASSSILPGSDAVLDTPMDYEAVAALGSTLGSASVIVLDESVDLAWAVLKTSRFFMHESCGKCTPCREGTYWMMHVAERIHAGDARADDVALLEEVARQIQGKCLCALGEFSTMSVVSAIAQFRTDFDAHVRGRP
jgi:NADH-quinone oxidoreductase subunit F